MRGVDLGQVLKRSVEEFSADDMLTYAAALSYQVFSPFSRSSSSRSRY